SAFGGVCGLAGAGGGDAFWRGDVAGARGAGGAESPWGGRGSVATARDQSSGESAGVGGRGLPGSVGVVLGGVVAGGFTAGVAGGVRGLCGVAAGAGDVSRHGVE